MWEKQCGIVEFTSKYISQALHDFDFNSFVICVDFHRGVLVKGCRILCDSDVGCVWQPLPAIARRRRQV